MVNPTLTFSPTSGKPGETAFLSFSGFKAGETVRYAWPAINYVQLISMNSAGERHGNMFIDTNRAPGKYLVTAYGFASQQEARTEFTVLSVAGQPPGTPEPGTDPGNVNVSFPVTFNSPELDIIEAFKQSGYWSQLNAQQQAGAQADPVAWLKGHPFLYSRWPAYFVDVSQKIPTDDPTGGLWHQAGDWLKSNWLVMVLLMAFASLALGYVFYGAKIKKMVKGLVA